jgi:hypothetical protein
MTNTKKTSKNSEEKKNTKSCWKGYERVPGKKPGSKGSCKKKKE